MSSLNIKIHAADNGSLIDNKRFPRNTLRRGSLSLTPTAKAGLLRELAAGDFKAEVKGGQSNEGGTAYLVRYAVDKLLGADAQVNYRAPEGEKSGEIIIGQPAVAKLVQRGFVQVNDFGLFEVNVGCDSLDEELAVRLRSLREGGKTEAEAKEIVLNNFYFKLPGNTSFRAEMMAQALPNETMEQRMMRLHKTPLDYTKHSKRYGGKTCAQFYADIDGALRTSGVRPELLRHELLRPADAQGSLGLGDKRNREYIENSEKIYEAYVVLRSIGYSWSDLCG